VEPPKDWLRILENEARLPLNEEVFMLAILSPITDIARAFELSPEIPAYNEPIILSLLPFCYSLC
jgi:hypothetical protein